jgi:hypothetical protein
LTASRTHSPTPHLASSLAIGATILCTASSTYSKLVFKRNHDNFVLIYIIQLRDIIEDGASVLDDNLNLNIE